MSITRRQALTHLARAGAYVDEPIEAPLSVTVYPGANGAFELYEDDGRSFAHRQGDWMRLAPGSRMRPPTTRAIEVRVAGTTTVSRVIFTGAPVVMTLR